VGDWVLNLRMPWMALVIFATTYLIAGGVYLVVTRLAVNERAKAFKAVTPRVLSRRAPIAAVRAAPGRVKSTKFW
jgi:hypothetical protein